RGRAGLPHRLRPGRGHGAGRFGAARRAEPPRARPAGPVRTAPGPASWSLLNPGAGGDPLFLVPAVGGTPLAFVALARSSPRPVYCASSPGLQGGGRPVTTVAAAAALYVAELRAIEPEGPYRVGGYCSGAMIALEMAHQLRAAGERVLPLV